MTAKSDFVSLFQDYTGQLSQLPESPILSDFNYMITSQRSVDMIAAKLEKISTGKVTGAEHGNFWPDLRTMGLADPTKDDLSEFGKATLGYFDQVTDSFKREHFMLSSIRHKSFEFPQSVYDTYRRKLDNLDAFLNLIPPSAQAGSELLRNGEKLFFTECLNAWPMALQRYFQLPPTKQATLDSLHENGLDPLFKQNDPKEADYYKLAHKFANECRQFERRTNFIMSTVLSEYEEAVLSDPRSQIPFSVLPRFAKILSEELLFETIQKSDLVRLIIVSKQIVAKTYADDPLPLPSSEDLQAAIAEIRNRLLVDDNVIRQIAGNLVAGKHILLAGPIATGKTDLAGLISRLIWKNHENGYYSDVTTATAEWTTQDVIGGIYPKLDEKGAVTYVVQRGCVTDTVGQNWLVVGPSFRRVTHNHHGTDFKGVWLVIDEFNRANIDKAFGELFTALESRKLKYPTNKHDQRFEELPIPKDYRIIATLNTFDKHFLFKLSDALKRRFAYVELLPPTKELADEEKYYIVLRALEDLPSAPPLAEKITLDKPNHRIVVESSDAEFMRVLDSAHYMFSFIREAKNLGTGILIAMFKLIFVENSMGVGLDQSLDDAFRSNVIPQLENLPSWSLETVKAFCCGSTNDLFKGKNPAQVDFANYVHEFRKVLAFLGKDAAASKAERYGSGKIEETEWTNYDPWAGKPTRPNLPLFRASLADLARESEAL